jgi:hypothetical protein
MIIFIPAHFEPHLHIDKKKHYIIHMNGETPGSDANCFGGAAMVRRWVFRTR